MEYPWYEIIKENSEILNQGDLIKDCPKISSPKAILEGSSEYIDIHKIDAIIISQSCDLINSKIELVVLCPYKPLSKFIDDLPDSNKNGNALKKTKENLKQGNIIGFHLLDKYENYIDDYLVIDFKNLFVLEIDILKNLAKTQANRLRLLHPYKEHLSQAFAKFFMRVGLPNDISI